MLGDSPVIVHLLAGLSDFERSNAKHYAHSLNHQPHEVGGTGILGNLGDICTNLRISANWSIK
jgi:hypothetical protein